MFPLMSNFVASFILYVILRYKGISTHFQDTFSNLSSRSFNDGPQPAIAMLHQDILDRLRYKLLDSLAEEELHNLEEIVHIRQNETWDCGKITHLLCISYLQDRLTDLHLMSSLLHNNCAILTTRNCAHQV